MAATPAILLFVYFFNLSTGYLLMDDNDNLDEFLMLPSEYSIKAERIDLISDMKLPMELWFSSDYNRSRVDVYNGMVRRYYYWGDDGATGTDGQVYMAYPKWTKKEGHTIFCASTGMDEDPATDVFPPEEEYVYAGTIANTGKKMHEGQKVDVWKFEEDGEETRREVVLYSYRTERGEDVPVQVEVKEMSTVKGSIDKHIILNYEQFEPVVSEEEVDAEKEGECEWTTDDFDGHIKMLHPVFHGHLDKAFESFKKHHSREYQHKKEHDMRKEIFHKNWHGFPENTVTERPFPAETALKFTALSWCFVKNHLGTFIFTNRGSNKYLVLIRLVVDHNRQDLGFKLALNHLSDLSASERARMKGGRRSSQLSATLAFPHPSKEVGDIVTQIPEEYDMRLEGYISPIKYQGNCGSCWSFATTAAVEGALARLDGRILDLSEQSVVDCSWEDENEGCNGGFPKSALQHIVNYGLPLEAEYGGYLAENGYCHIANVTEIFNIRGFAMVTPLSVGAMKVALFKYGPVVVTIQANGAFDFYYSGVFYDHTCEVDYVNHAVTIVGYGSRDGVGYWVVKNSYGQQWGEGGYMLLSQHNNNCYVLNEPYYPVV